MSAPATKIQGTTTIKWGTGSVLGTPSAAWVEKISVTPKYSGPVGEVENGDGAGMAIAALDDGFSAEVTCEYDTAQ